MPTASSADADEREVESVLEMAVEVHFRALGSGEQTLVRPYLNARYALY